MERLKLNGSMRGNMEKIAAFRAQFVLDYPTLPNFCPKCDYKHEKKLWIRSGYNAVCYSCGYKLKPSDYWLSEFNFDDR